MRNASFLGYAAGTTRGWRCVLVWLLTRFAGASDVSDLTSSPPWIGQSSTESMCFLSLSAAVRLLISATRSRSGVFRYGERRFRLLLSRKQRSNKISSRERRAVGYDSRRSLGYKTFVRDSEKRLD